MKFSLPVHSEGNIVDTTSIELSENDIQNLLDIICSEHEGNEKDAVKEFAAEIGIIQKPVSVEAEDSDRIVVTVRHAFYIRPDGDTTWVERIKQKGQ